MAGKLGMAIESGPHLGMKEYPVGILMLAFDMVQDRRRAAEMREVADTETAIGLDPLMALATAERQDWLADEAIAAPALKALSDE